MKYYILFFLSFVAIPACSTAQSAVSGRILRLPDSIPMAFANVGNMSAKNALATDENGRFTIGAHKGDTLFVSYVGYYTGRVVVEGMNDTLRIFLRSKSLELESVNIFGTRYRQDSLENRKEFKNFYEWHPVQPMELLTGGGISIDKLYELTQFRKNKRKEFFRNYLLYEEREKFVDYKFSAEYVAKTTQLNGDSLESFMEQFRPKYSFMSTASDYEIYLYVKKSLADYQNGKTKEIQPAKEK